MTPQEKRNIFFKENPQVYQQYNDIKEFNNSTQSNIERYIAIKEYAIKHTDFYAH